MGADAARKPRRDGAGAAAPRGRGPRVISSRKPSCMLFNSYAFLLVFLPAALIVYRFADPYPRLRMPVLVLLSLIFYGYWDVRFLPMLVGSILINWLAAKYYAATKRDAVVTAAIVLNLAVLAFFKYMNFFAETVSAFGLPI